MRIGIDVDSMTDSDMIKMASVFQNRRSLIFGFSISGEEKKLPIYCGKRITKVLKRFYLPQIMEKVF